MKNNFSQFHLFECIIRIKINKTKTNVDIKLNLLQIFRK